MNSTTLRVPVPQDATPDEESQIVAAAAAALAERSAPAAAAYEQVLVVADRGGDVHVAAMGHRMSRFS